MLWGLAQPDIQRGRGGVLVTSGTKKTKMGSLKRKPLSEQVYETVKGALLSGSLAPGDRINEVDLAAQLDVRFHYDYAVARSYSKRVRQETDCGDLPVPRGSRRSCR